MNTVSRETSLTALIASGDKDAFEELFLSLYPRLLSFARRVVGDMPTAEDMVQDCFIRLWEQRDELKDSSRALLFTMLRNACLNELRRRLVRGEVSLDQMAEDGDAERMFNLDFGYVQTTDAANAPDIALLCGELQQFIDNAVGELPPRTAEVFRLSREEGLKNREIADRLGITVKAVEKHITAALAHLRAALPPEYLLFLLLIC